MKEIIIRLGRIDDPDGLIVADDGRRVRFDVETYVGLYQRLATEMVAKSRVYLVILRMTEGARVSYRTAAWCFGKDRHLLAAWRCDLERNPRDPNFQPKRRSRLVAARA